LEVTSDRAALISPRHELEEQVRGVRLEGQKPSSSTIRSLGFAKWVSFSSRLPSARALASRATSVGAFTNSTLYGRYGRAADRDGQVRLADALQAGATIALSATLCGRRGILREFLSLDGVLSHDTFSRLFRLLHRAALRPA
jgi:hypothetical protein